MLSSHKDTISIQVYLGPKLSTVSFVYVYREGDIQNTREARQLSIFAIETKINNTGVIRNTKTTGERGNETPNIQSHKGKKSKNKLMAKSRRKENIQRAEKSSSTLISSFDKTTAIFNAQILCTPESRCNPTPESIP
jgi:hypothetical protein